MPKRDRDRRYREKRALRAGRPGVKPKLGWRTALRWANSPVGIPPLRYNDLTPQQVNLINTCREQVPFAQRAAWLKDQLEELRLQRRREQEYKPSGSPAPPISAHILHDARELSAGLQRLRVKKPIDN